MTNSLKIVTVVGARPQFIKAAVVSHRLQTVGLREVLVHTGQHFDHGMSDVFFRDLEIPKPSYELGIHGGDHGAMTGRMLEAIEAVLLQEHPDWLLVYGDTNSTLSGALAAAKLHIPVAHVEAGLRSWNREMPEEVNRVVVDHVADLLLTPTETATANLRREGIASSRIQQVGDVMLDAAIHFGALAERHSEVLDSLSVRRREYVLATVHRAENSDDPARLLAILNAFELVARKLDVVLPLHPRTRSRIEALGIPVSSNIRTIEPVGYLDMIALSRNALVIATDSGGLQKEAFFHGVPCVTLRTETEWTELVTLGWNTLVSPECTQCIAEAVLDAGGKRGADAHPYGHGDAAARIVERLGAGAR